MVIVDDGLIMFGKFVAGTLAIFVTIGIFLYGFDIKESLKDVESSTKAASTAAVSVGQIETAVQKAQNDVKTDETNAASAVAQANASLDALKKQITDIQDKQAQTTEAASKALAAQRNIDLAQNHMQSAQKDAARLLAQAQAIRDELIAKEKEADVAIAHIQSLAGSSTSASDRPATPAVPAAASGELTPDHAFTPVELAALYNFPPDLDGRGQTIGIVELGGGYDETTLAAYFRKLNRPVPGITWVSVDGAKNEVSDPNGADGEVQLNIEGAGAVAPAAKIVVYFCPNTAQGFIHAIAAATHDGAHHPSVLSVSWGGPEPTWSRDTMTSMNAELKSASDRGITVLASSGDHGLTDGMSNGQPAVDFPASSPWVTAVGGSHLSASSSAIESESIWGDGGKISSGRGVSTIFDRPPWQAGINAPKNTQGFGGRALPDLVADASPSTGYQVEVDGQIMVVGGTGASTPLWAGFIALLNQGLGHNIGFFNEKLYTKLGPASVFRKVEQEASQSTAAPSASGWSPLTGWGSPDGHKLLEALRQL